MNLLCNVVLRGDGLAVGWVERSDTQRFVGNLTLWKMLGIAALNPAYDSVGGSPDEMVLISSGVRIDGVDSLEASENRYYLRN